MKLLYALGIVGAALAVPANFNENNGIYREAGPKGIKTGKPGSVDAKKFVKKPKKVTNKQTVVDLNSQWEEAMNKGLYKGLSTREAEPKGITKDKVETKQSNDEKTEKGKEDFADWEDMNYVWKNEKDYAEWEEAIEKTVDPNFKVKAREGIFFDKEAKFVNREAQKFGLANNGQEYTWAERRRMQEANKNGRDDKGKAKGEEQHKGDVKKGMEKV